MDENPPPNPLGLGDLFFAMDENPPPNPLGLGDLFQDFPIYAASTSVSYDWYILTGEEGQVIEVCQDDSVCLTEVCATTVMIDRCSYYSVKDGLQLLPGEIDDIAVHETSSEVSTKIARTILKQLWINRTKGVCYSDFDETNVFVTGSGKAKIKNVRIRRNLTPKELKQGTRDNIRSARAIIGHIIYSGNPPPDIRHLLDLMQKDEYPHIWHVHASLLPIAAYGGFLKAMYDHIRHGIEKDELRAILKELAPYVEDYIHQDEQGVQETFILWQFKVKGNYILDAVLRYGNYNPPVPDQRHLTKRMRTAFNDLGIQPEAGQFDLTDDQHKLYKAFLFHEFLRNSSAHRLDRRSWWVRHLNNHTGRSFDSQSSERIVKIRFPLAYCHLQYQLCKLNREGEIPMVYFF